MRRLRGTGPGERPAATTGEPTWPLYPLRAGQVYVNFGFWGTVALPPGAADGHYNRQVEEQVTALGGHSVLAVDPAGGGDRTLATGLGEPQGLVVLPDGRLAATDSPSGVIVAIDGC